MFNNPYFNNQQSIQRIDQQIRDLESLRNNYQTMPQPIQNIIQNNPQNMFEAKYIGKNEQVEDYIVQHKTAFISLDNGFLKVKDIDGKVDTYELKVPKDERDIKIEKLEEELKKLKEERNDEYTNATKSVPKGKQTTNDKEYDRQ